MIRETVLTRSSFRSDEDWERVGEAAMKMMGTGEIPDSIQIPRRYEFESIATIPKEWHGVDPAEPQYWAATILPCR